MYLFLDFFFLIAHTALVLFAVTGWIFKRTRRFHLPLILLTWISWVGLGFFYGFGYCPCTDWHWQIKRALGEGPLPNSYIKYLLDRLTGLDWDAFVVDLATVGFALTALVGSIWCNWRDRQASEVE